MRINLVPVVISFLILGFIFIQTDLNTTLVTLSTFIQKIESAKFKWHTVLQGIVGSIGVYLLLTILGILRFPLRQRLALSIYTILTCSILIYHILSEHILGLVKHYALVISMLSPLIAISLHTLLERISRYDLSKPFRFLSFVIVALPFATSIYLLFTENMSWWIALGSDALPYRKNQYLIILSIVQALSLLIIGDPDKMKLTSSVHMAGTVMIALMMNISALYLVSNHLFLEDKLGMKHRSNEILLDNWTEGSLIASREYSNLLFHGVPPESIHIYHGESDVSDLILNKEISIVQLYSEYFDDYYASLINNGFDVKYDTNPYVLKRQYPEGWNKELIFSEEVRRIKIIPIDTNRYHSLLSQSVFIWGKYNQTSHQVLNPDNMVIIPKDSEGLAIRFYCAMEGFSVKGFNKFILRISHNSENQAESISIEFKNRNLEILNKMTLIPSCATQVKDTLDKRIYEYELPFVKNEFNVKEIVFTAKDGFKHYWNIESMSLLR
jgi:hypothetical protein